MMIAWFVAFALAAPPEVEARLRALIPDAQGTFYTTDLYRYIDGGAEAFHAYDMAGMLHCRQNGATVDIYDMGDPRNAFGVYSSERSPEQSFLPIGAEAARTESTLNFFQGSYYVKIAADSPAQMEALARAIERRIGGGKDMPAALYLLPREGLTPRSEKYVKKAPLGHDFLGPAWTGSYGSAVLALAEASGRVQAEEWITRLRDHFRATGKAAPWSGAPGAWRCSNSFEGEWLFLARGRWAVIVTDPPPDPEALLSRLKLP